MHTLSIMILTRNRKQEILRALHSCVDCDLPEDTEFVIVDNASEDGTKEAVEQFFSERLYQSSYCYLDKNIGVAAGRNLGLRRASGQYIYFMDDDAYVDAPKSFFFEKMINFLQANKKAFGVTTLIFDTALNGVRPLIKSKAANVTGYDRVLMFHGGSFLVDKLRLFDQNKLFLEQQLWGMEELYPSLKHFVNDQYVAEMTDVAIIHDPSLNTRFDRKKYVVFVCVGSAHVKFTLYPLVAYPVIYLLFCLRIIKHLGIRNLYSASRELSQINRSLIREPIPLSKFISLIKDFGFVAVF